MSNRDKERVELHCHSIYSELDGVSSIRDIVDFAGNNGMPAIAITDHASVAGYGEASFYASQYDGLKVIYGMEGFVVNDLEPSVRGDEKYIRDCPSFHVTFLIQNEIGKQNLYKLMSLSEEKYKGLKPRIPWSEIERYREGLLVGSACEVGELYLAIMNDNEPDDKLEEIARKYDFIEVQPAENKLYCIDEDECSYVEGLAYVRTFDRKVIEIGEKLGKIVVATSDAHFVSPDEAVVRSILQRHVGYADDYQLELHLRTTEEMLKSFDYLGQEKAYEIVVENTNRIADMIERVEVSQKTGVNYPVIDNAYERLKDICEEKLVELYGDNIPQGFYDQLNWELMSFMQSGSDSIMLLVKELVEESGLSPYEYGYRGCLGGSLVAFLCGITCVNPLESKMPLYPEFLIGLNGDKFLDVDLNIPSKIIENVRDACNDLEDVGAAFHAGTLSTILDAEAWEAIEEYQNYHGVLFEDERKIWIAEKLATVVNGHDMHPGAMLMIPEEYDITEFSPLVKDIESGHMITGMDYHYMNNLYWMDILTNHSVDMVYQLIGKTGVNVADISLDDVEVGRVFGGKGKVTATGIPEVDTLYARQVAKEYGVESFTDLVQFICLLHGTNTWIDNAEDLLHQEGFTKNSVLASREDVFDCLKVLGFCREDAFHIAEFVRKGRARSDDERWKTYKNKIEEAGAPEWFAWSCERIRYMFPRAHAYQYALHAWWTAWFKLHYPKQFYETYIELLDSEELKQIIPKGKDYFEAYKMGYMNAISDGFLVEDTSAVNKEALLVIEEMFQIEAL